MSKVASTTVLADVSRMALLSARSPRMSDKAPKMMDLPAPVSPVMMVKPSANAMSSLSMRA